MSSEGRRMIKCGLEGGVMAESSWLFSNVEKI
jgi:hypothetical protein